MRAKYGDSPNLLEWELHRLIAFALRPNFHMRARLRRTLKNVVQLHADGTMIKSSQKSSSSSASGDSAGDSVSSSSSISSSSSSSSSGQSRSQSQSQHSQSNNHVMHGMHPCIGLHVRHGDALSDHRGRSNLDRSLEAHVDCVRQIARPLGVARIYLATDNVKLFTAAPSAFEQEFEWFAQIRSLKAYKDGVADPHHNEKSKAQDVANMLVRMYDEHTHTRTHTHTHYL